MWQKILLQSKKNSPDQGFLTLEIILATLVAFFFLMFSLQALAAAMFMKVQAQQKQRAEQLIQEDIETLGNFGSNLPLDLVTCNAADYVDGYARDLWDTLDDPGTVGVHEGNQPVTIALLDAATGSAVLRLSRTNVSLNNSVAPHRTFSVFYQVTASDDANFGNADDTIVATRYVEIIPDQALRCP